MPPKRAGTGHSPTGESGNEPAKSREVIRKQLESRRQTLLKKLIAAHKKAAPNKRKISRGTRKNHHEALVVATAMYEDFLYFQTPERRNEFFEHIDAIETDGIPETKRSLRIGQRPMLLIRRTGHEEELMQVLQEYERDYVGMTEEMDWEDIEPRDLHVRVPASRRTAVGLGRPMPAQALLPLDLRVNYDAVEAERKRIEDTKPSRLAAEDGTDETHSARRARQVASFGELPTDTWINATVPTAIDLGKTRLKNGLFLSAGESSRDWNTSFDQLDYVRTGHIAVESCMIAEIDEDSGESRWESVEQEAIHSSKQSDEGVEGDFFEFEAPQRPRKQYKLVESTQWVEAAYGRREREHAYMDVRPSSPVLSPPHSPIYPIKTAEHTLYIPVDIHRDHVDYTKFCAKFGDPYGVNYVNFADFRGRPQGQGFTIAYEPLDVDALPEKLQARYLISGDLRDKNGRFRVPAPEGTSMRLLREAKGEPYKPPHWDKSHPNSEDNGESSDDDGDLFRLAYLQASQPQAESEEVNGNDCDVVSVAAGPFEE
ncbi:hypothetical protein FB567DRAFT_609869 [Paraphoma chrysanthemicola]|uniref:Uncharacterized protein n=1 Tax=Paraphoma chrysanthemicola TaxID=798071 RepID=A0A8K0RD62_9PLEO|nr:hypothetical protein FB567DRAFT_609869 [Paraphoma chrysanthemicola]